MRKLGYIESIYHILSTYCGILRNVGVLLEFNGDISIDTIRNYLNNLFEKFPALRLKVIEKENIPYFDESVSFANIPIQVLQNPFGSLDSCFALMEEEMSKPIDVTHHMWRAKIIVLPRCNYLLLTFHHSIFDGKSIVKLLNFISDCYHNEKEIVAKSSEILPPIESVIKKEYISLSPTLQVNDAEKILTSWQVHKPAVIGEQRSKTIRIDADFLDVHKLRSYCAINKITINSILNAVMLKALAKTLKKNASLVLHTPIDLVRLANMTSYGEEIGCFIGIIHTILHGISEEEDLISLANRYNQEFIGQLNKIFVGGEFNYQITKDILIKRFSDQTTRFFGGIALSNIGEIDIGKSKLEAIIKDIYFSASLTGGLGIFVLSVLTFNNHFKLTLTYTEPLLSKAFIDGFILAFRSECQELAKNMEYSISYGKRN